jgi:hypothetical protein
MTATNPSAAGAGQPAVQPQPSAAAVAGGVGGAALLVATRVALWLGVQLLLASLLVLGGAEPFGRALNEAAGWWMVYGALVDLGTLGVILWLLRRDGGSYRDLLGPPSAAWQVALGVLAASVPAVVLSPRQANGVIMRRRRTGSSGDQRSGPRPVADAGVDANTRAAHRGARPPTGDVAGLRRWP